METFNGFGYRAPTRNIPSPYLVGGTSVQKRGKFTAAQAVAMAEDASGPLLDDGLEPTSDMPTSP